MGPQPHSHRRRHRSPSSDSSDSDHSYGRHHRSHHGNPPKTSYYPRRESDRYYHSEDSARGRSRRSRRHDKPTYVTDPDSEDYDYEIPRSRIGSVEPVPESERHGVVSDVLAAFGIMRKGKGKKDDKDTLYVNPDRSKSHDRDRSRRSRRRHRHYGSDSSSEDEGDRRKDRKHEKRKQHFKEAAAAGKLAYSLHKHNKKEKAERAQKEREERWHERERDERAAAGIGAAGAGAEAAEHHRDHRDRRYSHSDHGSSTGSRRSSRHHGERAAVGAAGVSAAEHHRDRHHRGGRDRSPTSRSRSSRSSRSRSRSTAARIRDNEHNPDANQALRAAITAAVLEAFRSRKDESGLTSARLMRIVSAAVAAGGLDAVMQHHDGSENSEQLKHIIEAVIGGVKSSQFFGHRIRRRHGIGQGELVKTNLMRLAAGKALDRGAMGHRGKNPRPKKERYKSSNRISSAWRALNDEHGGA